MRNHTNGEFIFYDLMINVLQPDSFEVIHLQSVIRESVTAVISLENPLDHPVDFKEHQIMLNNDNLMVSPSSFTIQPKTEIGLELTYRPLVEGEASAQLKLTSDALGDFVYDLKLLGKPSTAFKTLNFKANLGSDTVQQFKFINYVRKPTTYQVRIEPLSDKGSAPQTNQKKQALSNLVDFTSESNTINAPAADSREGIEVPVNINFEPASISESRAILKISSPEGGEYSCYLIGQTLTPQPKGPYHTGNKAATIVFKNPFKESKEFTVRLDNPSFTSGAKTPLRVDGKKTQNIQVSYKPTKGYSNNGRLILEADNS